MWTTKLDQHGRTGELGKSSILSDELNYRKTISVQIILVSTSISIPEGGCYMILAMLTRIVCASISVVETRAFWGNALIRFRTIRPLITNTDERNNSEINWIQILTQNHLELENG